jgi:IclR family pca regulon transcriptional regulator
MQPEPLAEDETATDLPGEEGDRRNRFVVSLARGLAVIRAFGADTPEMTLSEVARRTGLTRANARRILLTLHELGYVEQDGRGFRLSPRILDLGYAYLSGSSLARLAQPIMEDLVSRLHRPCNLGVLNGSDVIYVGRVSSKRIVHVDLKANIGSRFPAPYTAMGRVLLAGLPSHALEARLATLQLEQHTPRSVVDPEILRGIIAQDRSRGWSVVDQELEPHVADIAVPIRNAAGDVVAGLSMGWFSISFSAPEAIESLLPDLRDAAARLGDSLGLIVSRLDI